jgi:hypothetical protein
MTLKTYFNISNITTFIVILICFTCCEGDKSCDYNAGVDLIPVGCDLQSDLNLTTGINNDATLLVPGLGVIDPSWKVLNNPPLLSCDPIGNPLVETINGNAYAVNFADFGINDWVNQAGATTLAPMDLGTIYSFGCNNATNSEGKFVPYVFERNFCVLKNTIVDFDFSYKGDDQIYFELINNNNNEVISTSALYVYNAIPMIWSGNNIALNIGSYSIRGYLANTSSVVLGYSMLGNLVTSNGDKSISNNNDNCCQNNTISILNVIDNNCDSMFDNIDGLGKNWTITVKNSSNEIIRTGTTDANGNIFFSGIQNGVYTVQITPQTSFTTTVSSFSVNLANNSVQIVEFYNCPI